MQSQTRLNDKVGYSLVTTLECPKLSERAKGNLHFQIWKQNERDDYGVAISQNESTGGFSNELIEVEDVLKLLRSLQKQNKPFHATVFKELFIGKSSNNHCFLAAVLVHQNVIVQHSETARLLEVSANFELWSQRLQNHTSTPQSQKVDPIHADEQTHAKTLKKSAN